MSNSENIKPTFGREMEPCEYNERWANKMSKDEVIAIKAENTKSIDRKDNKNKTENSR